MNQGNYLIIGAGVAGISVAKHLIDRGNQITLLDSGINRSSSVAAGMINPMVFRRMTKCWRVDDFLPYAETFYTSFGEECAQQFYYPIAIRRMFASEQERGYWIKKQELEEFSCYLTKVNDADNSYSGAINQFGSGRVKQGSYISTTAFLQHTKNWIAKQHLLIEERVDYAAIDPSTASYKGIVYDGIVFCEGVEVRNNPWFGTIPVNPTKGETLTISCPTLTETESLNRKCFVLPTGNNEFKIGATYVWDTMDDAITAEGKLELEEMLGYLTKEKYTVLNQSAGIRPTMLDRRPVLGSHAEHTKLHIFNGMGTKGYLLAPLMAKEMVDYLLEGKILDKEVSLTRFAK